MEMQSYALLVSDILLRKCSLDESQRMRLSVTILKLLMQRIKFKCMEMQNTLLIILNNLHAREEHEGNPLSIPESSTMIFTGVDLSLEYLKALYIKFFRYSFTQNDELLLNTINLNLPKMLNSHLIKKWDLDIRILQTFVDVLAEIPSQKILAECHRVAHILDAIEICVSCCNESLQNMLSGSQSLNQSSRSRKSNILTNLDPKQEPYQATLMELITHLILCLDFIKKSITNTDCASEILRTRILRFFEYMALNMRPILISSFMSSLEKFETADIIEILKSIPKYDESSFLKYLCELIKSRIDEMGSKEYKEGKLKNWYIFLGLLMVLVH
jgi:hypothetical protein